MILGVLLIASTLGLAPADPVPAVLTESQPSLALRWRTLALASPAGDGTSHLTADATALASLTRSAVLRVQGRFAAGCAPIFGRRFVSPGGEVQIPLPTPAPRPIGDGGAELVLGLSPALGPDPTLDEPPPTLIALTLPHGCASVDVTAFEADEDPDPDAEMRALRELDALVTRLEADPQQDEAALARWLEAAHPHAWQQQAALALLLPRLVGPHDPAVRQVATALLSLATAELRTHNASFILARELLRAPSAADVPGESGRWVRLEPGHDLTVDLDDAETVALSHRGDTRRESRAPVAWHLGIAFDSRPEERLPAHAPIDPAARGQSRTRSATLVVPPGARRMRLRAIDRPVFVRASGVHGKAAISDLWRRPPDAAGLLNTVAASPGTTGPLRALVRALLGHRDETHGHGVLGALTAILQAGLAVDSGAANRLLEEASRELEKPHGPLEQGAARILRALAARARATRATALGDARAATAIWLELAAREPLCDEDAEALLEADAFANERLEGAPLALEIVDGLLVRRPLDRALARSRAHAFTGAARWQELVADSGLRETPFLDPLPASAGVPAPESTGFAAIGGTALDVELAPPPLPGHLPVLSLIARRPAGAAPGLQLRLDGHPITLPVVGPFERTELPLGPGRHTIERTDATNPTEVLSNFATDEGPRWRRRRYLEIDDTPVELRNREMGAADVLLVAVRTVSAPGASRPGPFDVLLASDDATPVALHIEPGVATAGPFGDVDPDRLGTAPIETLLPIGRGHAVFRIAVRGAPPGARVFVHVAARRRQPVTPPAPPSTAALDRMRAVLTGEVGVAHVATLTRRLAVEKPRGPVLLARALTLAALEEPTLAREDLAGALADPALPAPERWLALALWRHLDAVSSLNYPLTVDARSTVAHAPGLGLGAVETHPRATLSRLIDDRARLRNLSPHEADADPLALLAAARQAERDRDPARAGDLWEALAVTHQNATLYTRAGAALLSLPPDPIRDLRSYVALHTATDLDPYDAAAGRLQRRASGRTRLTPIHEVDDSAGVADVASDNDERNADTVEAALLGPTSAREAGDLVTGERQLKLALELTAPTVVRVMARLRELRPRAARVLGAPKIDLVWAKDGLPGQRISCTRGGLCRSGPLPLPSGSHSLAVRLAGGLRPAARVVVLSGSARTTAASHDVEYLRARDDRPLVATLFGPAVIEAELRAATPSRSGAAARAVSISMQPSTGPAIPTRDVVLPALSSEPGEPDRRLAFLRRDDRRAPAIARAPTVTTTLILPRDQAYRIVVRPPRGEALCRLLVRDGAGTDAPPPPPTPVLTRADAPSPLYAPLTLQQGLTTRVVDDDVAPGLDAFGALAFEVGWRAVADLGEQDEQVYAKSAAYGSITYRRLVERLHLTFKAAGEGRRWTTGDTSGGGELHAYFLHPDARWARGLISLGADAQTVGVGRIWDASGIFMFEPIATLASAVHIVSKFGLRLRRLSIGDLDDDDLRRADPQVFNIHAAHHPRALFWEEGLELEPLSNLLLYSGARVTTNADLSVRHPDHLSGEAVARTIFGRLQIEGGFSVGYFFVDEDRSAPLLRRQVALTSLYTLWWGHRNALALALTVAHHFDLGIDQASLGLAWEFSNGRRLRDHTAVEEENYFFPQRGPEREAATLEVDGPPAGAPP